MSATRELQRRLLAEATQPRFEPCLASLFGIECEGET